MILRRLYRFGYAEFRRDTLYRCRRGNNFKSIRFTGVNRDPRLPLKISRLQKSYREREGKRETEKERNEMVDRDS